MAFFGLFGGKKKEGKFKVYKLKDNSHDAHFEKVLQSKDRHIKSFKAHPDYQKQEPHIKKQINELEKVKTKEGLIAHYKRYFKSVPEILFTKPKLEEKDVKNLSFIQRQYLGYMRARKLHPIQSRLTAFAIGVLPLPFIPNELALVYALKGG